MVSVGLLSPSGRIVDGSTTVIGLVLFVAASLVTVVFLLVNNLRQIFL